ncbi:hypothetical protein E2C01_037105 [Portunus trituberculatus]|uniref:Uncharacterized protein n=1 Tax=Portunus trituberculatus TaxID=210409 RepID=A0A5B7FD31_PORTR|nr:hypothetical protein [Portunus trituberculatus]
MYVPEKGLSPLPNPTSHSISASLAHYHLIDRLRSVSALVSHLSFISRVAVYQWPHKIHSDYAALWQHTGNIDDCFER